MEQEEKKIYQKVPCRKIIYYNVDFTYIYSRNIKMNKCLKKKIVIRHERV